MRHGHRTPCRYIIVASDDIVSIYIVTYFFLIHAATPSLDDYDWEVFCKFQHNAYDCLNDGIGRTRYAYASKSL